MSVAYGIIQRHNGTIEIESELGKGAQFTIILPLAPPGEAEEEKTKDLDVSNLAGHVLVIDDEDFIGEIVSDTLKEVGCSVDVTTDPREGVKMYSRNSYDVVITDLGMPVLSGWDVAEQIRNIDSNAVIVLLTGWGGTIDEKEERKENVDVILGKPIHMNDLIQAVHNCFTIRKEKLAEESQIRK